MERKTLGHLMIDLETMGKDDNPIICSIGAIEFDINTGEIGEKFFVRIDMTSCHEMGFTITPSTIEWWLMQSEAARKMLVEGEKIHINLALSNFSTFIRNLGDVQVWGNGIAFDLVKLGQAYKKCQLNIPWNFRNERDVRTLVSLAPHIKDSYQITGVEHNPIDDCYHQIRYCCNIWQKINPEYTNQLYTRILDM